MWEDTGDNIKTQREGSAFVCCEKVYVLELAQAYHQQELAFYFFFKYFIYLFQRERESVCVCVCVCAQGRQEQMETDKQTPRWVPSPMRGSIPRPCDHDLS